MVRNLKEIKELETAIQYLKEAELILRLSGWSRTHSEVVEVLKKANTLVVIAKK